MDIENSVPTIRFGNQNACKISETQDKKRRPVPTTKRFRDQDLITPISSTASSPGYISRDQMNSPPDQSFTTALKALQERPANGWDYLSSINGAHMVSSKWNEAEKYICNPLSGRIPVECLSTKSLSGRAQPMISRTRSMLTMSCPLDVLSETRFMKMRTNLIAYEKKTVNERIDAKDMVVKKQPSVSTRDVGVQSSLPELSSSGSNSSPAISPDSRSSSILTSSISQGSIEKPNKCLQAKDKANKNKVGFGNERKKKKMVKWKPWSCLSLARLLSSRG